MAIESSRRAGLEIARLQAILRARFGIDPDEAELSSAAFGVVARHGPRTWIASSSEAPSVLGGVLVWAMRNGTDEVDLIVEHHAGMHARRARTLVPAWTVWRVDGSELERVDVEPLPTADPAIVGVEDIEASIVSAGATVVHEAGIVRAEVRGLEVGRVVHGADGPVLEAGVGRFDREAGALLHPDRAPTAAIADVVAQVEPHRRAGAPPHPLNRLARGRWLRSLVLDDPAIAGVSRAVPVDPVPARHTLSDEAPGAAIGVDGDRVVLVVCSTGVDLGLVPETADLIDRHRPDEVRVVMPRRDRLPSVEALVSLLARPVVFVDIVPPWRSAAGSHTGGGDLDDAG